MGEAKRRRSRPPTPAQRVVRWINGVWLLYPKSVRTFYRVNAQIVGGFALVILGVVVVALFAQWLMHR